MNTTELLCAEIELRLVDGRPVAEDPEVAAHVRSCLRCFRAASELRQVPRLAALLRQGQLDEQPDPGDLFWARFPKTVADAWERRQQSSSKPAPVAAWRRASGWFRRPLPAAFAGAAVAAALVLVVMHRSPVPRAAAPMAVAPTEPPALAETSTEDEGPAGLLGEDDPLDSLDLADTKLVARVGGAEAQGSDEGSELGPSPAEELELLETDDLRAVAQALHGRSI